MFFARAAAAAVLISAASAAPREALSQRGDDAVIQYVDPCSVDENVVPPHGWLNKGILPPKVEECLVTNLGPTFINAFYAAYTNEITDNSVDINGNHVNIDNSIVGNQNDDNVIGNDNVVGNQVVGDDNVTGNHNAVANGDGNKVSGGTGNGNGIGNIDHSTVNSTTSEVNGNNVKGSAGNDLTNDTKNNGNTNSTSAVSDSGNDTDTSSENSGNDSSTDSSTNDSNNGSGNGNQNNPAKRDLGSAASKRHVESCFGLKCMGSVNKVLPCIFTATKTHNPKALLACGVPKKDLCSCTACLPADVADYVDDHCKGGPSPLDGVKVSEDLVDADFVESTDNNVRAFLGLITRSEIKAIRDYEMKTAARIGARSEDSCTLGTRCGDECTCCLGTCGLKGGLSHCYGMC